MASFLERVGGAIAGAGAGVILGGPAGIPGAVAALGGAAAGQSDAAQKAIKEAERALATAAEAGEKIAKGIGEVIIKVTETAFEFAKGLIPGAIGIRPLRQSEINVARLVFKDMVQYDRVRIVSAYGVGARPFCIPGGMLGQFGWKIPAVGPLLAWTSIVTGLSNTYIIFMGDDGFRDALNYQLGKASEGTLTNFRGQTLIHELTHVWQGNRRTVAWEYVFNSLWNQCRCGITGKDAYAYTTGKQWSEYTPEQQGKIVEHWFVKTNGATNETLDAARQPYIDTNIRAGSIDAQIPKSSFGTIVSGFRVGPTMTQLLDVLDTLKPQRTALMPYRHQIAIQAQIQMLDSQILQYEGMVRALVAQGELIEDRARFAMSMGAGPRISATAPAKLSPILRR